tara:strand:- start:214 stop:501 length:288 start_codon:yes stop_codon:yes gene_type:complete
MKFLAVVALVAIASAAECTEEELAETDPAKCTVTTPEVVAVEAEGENDAVEAADESIDCVEVEDDTECDEDDEEEASSALFASVATAAVAATMMF